jgi:hypothetical protein
MSGECESSGLVHFVVGLVCFFLFDNSFVVMMMMITTRSEDLVLMQRNRCCFLSFVFASIGQESVENAWIPQRDYSKGRTKVVAYCDG